MRNMSTATEKDYIILKTIGKGSYGEVYLVRKKREKKQLVMKNIRLSSGGLKERMAATQEAALLSQLQHPNIVSYHESFQDDEGILHIVMAYCEGGDLCSRLQSYGSQLLSEEQVVEWFVQIALALQYLHDRKIMHRDLKTQNIFLSKHDVIKVGDLGIARVLEGSLDLAHTVVGTPYYMSPELFANKPYSFKSDVWALGCCVYEMASLKRAFSARNISALMYKILQGQVPPLPSCFSRDLNVLVCQMLSQEATHRPSVQQILRTEYIRSHIRHFLARASDRKKKTKIISNGPSQLVDKGLKIDNDSKPSCQVMKPLPSAPPPSATPTSVEHKPELSSAREKRRRYKQEARGRVVLRSRSADHLPNASPPTIEETDSGGSGKEEDEVITIMDTTLHLPDPKSPHSHQQSQHTEGQGSDSRLKERASALRRDCCDVLGQEVVCRALYLLDRVTPEDSEREMIKLLGEENCQTYLVKLQQLKLCEESLNI